MKSMEDGFFRVLEHFQFFIRLARSYVLTTPNFLDGSGTKNLFPFKLQKEGGIKKFL